MDISNSKMYNLEKYINNFKIWQGGKEVARFGQNSGNMTAMLKAVMGVKGSLIHNKVLAKHTQQTGGLVVEMASRGRSQDRVYWRG